MKEKERIALVPGSFDPITNGHISVIERAAELYDKVIVAVMINASKEYMFTLDERKRIAEACFKGRDNISVISSDGWLWQLANQLDASAIVKGYRNQTDLEYEEEMAKFNDAHCSNAKTVLLKSEDELVDLSSTEVRKKILRGDDLDGLLPKEAIEVIKTMK